MQGQKNTGGSFTETVDLNQGPVSSSSAMNQSSPWNNVPNPVESSRLLLSSAERNITRETSGIRGFSGWDLGESSAGANVQGQGVVGESFDGGFLGNQGINRPLFMQNPSSSPTPLNIEQIISGNASSPNIGTSGHSGNAGESDNGAGGSAPSVGSWGSSCKRKAVEGTSDQAFSVGSSNSHYNAPGNLSISSPPVTSSSTTNPSEQLNPRPGLSMWVVGSDLFPPSAARGIAETSSRNYSSRLNLGHTESVRFNLPTTANASRHSDSPNQSSYPVHAPDMSRNMLPFSWNGANSRAGASSNPLMLSGDRRGASSSRDEGNFGSSSRNSMEHPMFVPAAEARNLIQDPNNWNLSTGSVPPHSVLPAWIHDHPNPPAQNQQRLSEYSPWTLFPSVGSEPGGQRGHFPHMRPGPSSEERMMSPSGGNNQGHRHPPHPRSAWLMEGPGDDVTGWRALATDIEGRHRLVSEIRQVLNAMRRSENIRAEDYMLFDPFINGVPELHDRHRDMRLDVDNMSYEELLALEERIGDVNTGLSDEAIAKSMQQEKFLSIMEESPTNMEPCCICREEYVSGDDLGKLNCGHDFHTDCIKQWLKQKNICPICKMTGLST